VQSAILPLVIGGETQALDFSAHLRARGLFIPAIRYPTVPRGQARLRLTVTANHRSEQVTRLLEGLTVCRGKFGAPG
jgi:7-keto-8-aminopelargonate synthetase-like enzyme